MRLPTVLVLLAVMGLLLISARESATLNIILVFIIAELSNAGTLIAFVAVSVSMIVLRRRRPDLERPFKTPVYWLTALVAILGCGFIFSSLPVQSQVFTLIWMVIGLNLYFSYGYWHSRIRKRAEK